MPIERINPPQLIPPEGHTHVVKVMGGTTLYLSGQGAYTADQTLVGPGDHYAQARQALANVVTALAAAGATFRDVVKATYYIARLTPEALEAFTRALAEVPDYDPERPPAATLVGVASLAFEEMLIEIDVTAVIG